MISVSSVLKKKNLSMRVKIRIPITALQNLQSATFRELEHYLSVIYRFTKAIIKCTFTDLKPFLLMLAW